MIANVYKRVNVLAVIRSWKGLVMPKKSKKTVTLRIDAELLEAVEKLSDAESRSVNNSIERILELAKEWIEAKTKEARREGINVDPIQAQEVEG